jgi:hypothetical protein
LVELLGENSVESIVDKTWTANDLKALTGKLKTVTEGAGAEAAQQIA